MQHTRKPYKTLLFGFAFSPTLQINLVEALRLAHLLGARVILLHAGRKTARKEEQIRQLLSQSSYPQVQTRLEWEKGKPYAVLQKRCEDPEIDLLILGAKQHENLYRFYVGSVARKLTRKVRCSVLLLIKPSLERVPCEHIVVNGLEEQGTSWSILVSCFMAQALGARRLTVVEEIQPQEVHISVEDDQSLERAAEIREQLSQREARRVEGLLKEVPADFQKGLQITNQSIFGLRGYSIGHFAEVVRADLLVMNAPKSSRLWDRVFTHDIEHILSDLPTDTLIVRQPNHG